MRRTACSQMQLARLAGISQPTISNILSGAATRLRSDTLTRLRSILDEPGFETLAERQGPVANGHVLTGGKYEIIDEMGRSPRGYTYRARDRSLEVEVVLKFLPFDGAWDRHQHRTRTLQEVARISSHPNILSIRDAGLFTEADRPYDYIVCDLAEKGSLSGWHQDDDGISLAHALLEACRGMAYAHSHGIFHGNVKPSNLLVGTGGVTTVADFDLDRTLREHLLRGSTGIAESDSQRFAAVPRGRERILLTANDIGLMGAAFYEIATGISPALKSEAQSPTGHNESLLHSPHEIDHRVPNGLSLLLMHMVACCQDCSMNDFGDICAHLETLLPPPSVSEVRSRRALQ